MKAQQSYVEQHLTQHGGKRAGMDRKDLFGVSLKQYERFRAANRFSLSDDETYLHRHTASFSSHRKSAPQSGALF